MTTIPFQSSQFARTTATSSTSSGATPRTATVTLPGEGVWLVTVEARLNGSDDHAMVSTFIVAQKDNGSNDMGLSTLIGATGKASGSSFGLSSLTLGNPNSAGECTASAAWTDGNNKSVSWKWSMVKIHAWDLI